MRACQNTIREPAKKNMYKGVSAAYSIIVLSYWILAFCGYWAFGSEVKPYILTSLSSPEWTIVMANLFAVVQISGCYQVLFGNCTRRTSQFKLTSLLLYSHAFFFHLSRQIFDELVSFRYTAGQHIPTLRKDCCPTKLTAIFH